MTHPIGTRGRVGYCVEAHDLAASKLAAFRDKDRVFVTALLAGEHISPALLLDRVSALPVQSEERARLTRWVEAVARELDRDAG